MSDLHEIIMNSKSAIELAESLKDNSMKFRNLTYFTEYIEEEWKKGIDISKIVLSDDVKTWPIKISKDGVDYYIYGFIHGLGPISPGWNPDSKVINFINDIAKEVHNQKAGSDYFYEQSIGQNFQFLKENEIKDFTESRYNQKPNYLKFAASFVVLLHILPIFLVYSRVKSYWASKIKNPKNLLQMDAYLAYRSTIDPKFLSQFSQFRIASQMPQPLSLEIDYLGDKGPRGKMTDSLYMQPNMATSAERSFFAAKELISLAKERKLREVHYFAGLNHITQIAYFIENQDYSFEKIRNFAEAFGR